MQTGERWPIAEVLRVKARLLSTTGVKADQLETLLVESLTVARRQRARCGCVEQFPIRHAVPEKIRETARDFVAVRVAGFLQAEKKLRRLQHRLDDQLLAAQTK